MFQYPRVETRRLCAIPVAVQHAQDIVQLDILAAVPLANDSSVARLYLHQLADQTSILPEGIGGLLWSRLFVDAAVINVTRDAAGMVPVPVAGCTTSVSVAKDESQLFADREVLVGHCNGETPDILRDWLVWHRRHHVMTGALIVDRGEAAAVAQRAEHLQQLLQQDPDIAALLAGVRIVIVSFDRPLGDGPKGHEGHLMNAPDAPGKDRMAAPDPDPWHAPLAYRPLFDLLRHKFLSRARAVASIEVIDLIAPTTPTIFAQVSQSQTGQLTLKGRQVYPWGLRNDAAPGFADHVCHRFDETEQQTRWCVAPALLPDQAIWMPMRILGSHGTDGVVPFHRFMALRHGRESGANIGQIVPKTSLVEDDTLIARALAAGADPLRPVAELPSEARVDDKGEPLGNRVVVVTTMKNEGPFILEWIAYHRAIGVSDFLIYTNDCTDGTDDLLQLLDRKGLCQWRDNPYRDADMKPQHAALEAANAEPLVKAADWAICMDVDEYIAIHIGDRTLSALFDAIGDANMISLTWRLFGNADIDAFEDRFITQSFTRCANPFANKPHQAWGFKTLYRNIGLFRKLGVHRPKGLLPMAVDRIRWVNGSGQPMPKKEWRTAWRSHSGTYGYDLVSLNHYAVRSAESFLVKRDRGRVNHVDRDQGLAYWFRMNHNVVENHEMATMLPLLQAEYQKLLADPEIKAAHTACVAAHKAKIAELKTQAKYHEFHAELTSARMQKLSRLHGHFGSNVYLAGPQVIPDDIVDKAPDSTFFFTVDKVDEANH